MIHLGIWIQKPIKQICRISIPMWSILGFRQKHKFYYVQGKNIQKINLNDNIDSFLQIIKCFTKNVWNLYMGTNEKSYKKF